MLKSTKGSAMLGAVIACMVIAVFATLLLEWHRVYTVKENIDRELSRAVNLAIDLSMDDTSRGYHSSKINADNARNEFYSYLENDMNLGGSLRDPNDEFGLVIENLDIQSNPPSISVIGHVELKAGYFSMMPKVNIPVKAKSRNRRTDDG